MQHGFAAPIHTTFHEDSCYTASPVTTRSTSLLRSAREHIPATLFTVVAALGLLQITALILLTLYRHFDWSYQAEQKRAVVQQLQLEVKELRERQKLSSDPAYLEGLARKQGFIREGERVIVPKP
jgi:cell division protein FtsB